MDTTFLSETIVRLLQENRMAALRLKLNELVSSQLVEIIEELPDSEKLLIFNELDAKKAVETFEFLSLDTQKDILYQLTPLKAAEILNQMSPDDRTSFLEELPSAAVKDLIKLLSPKERKLTLKLLGYPDDSVGRLMTPDYIAVRPDWNVQQLLAYIRKRARETEVLDVFYAVDENYNLIGEVQLRDCLLAPPNKKLRSLINRHFISLLADEPSQDAIEVFRKSGRIALPAVDHAGILLGVVTLDDILEIASEEFTEDIQKVGGVAALEEPYMKTPFFELMRKRLGWLVVLFLGEMFTATAMSFFEGEIAKAVILTLFIPLIISSGGNSGSQASTLIIRSLALKEIDIKDWYQIFRREIYSGLFLGSVLGFIGFFRVMGWAFFSDMYGEHAHLVGLTVGCSLVGIVLWGTVTGSMLPLILQRLGFDPAVCSAPFVATLVDVTGLIIYFSIALFFLQGTLL